MNLWPWNNFASQSQGQYHWKELFSKSQYGIIHSLVGIVYAA